MNKKTASIVFFVAGLAAAVLFIVLRHSVPLPQAVLLKAIPTLLMAAWILVVRLDKSNAWIFAGLLFSMIGDIFMELPGETAFMVGIGANTLGIVCYTLYFYFSDRSPDLVRFIPVAIVMGVFYIILYDYLGDLKVAVFVYCFIHALFLWRSSARFGEEHISPASQYVCFIGCVSVTISDFLLSLTIFGIIPNVNKFQIVDMILWWSGLFMLTVTAEIRRRNMLASKASAAPVE